MSIAEKLTALSENMPKVFEAGINWVFAYAEQVMEMFYRAQFPEGTTLDIAIPNVLPNLQSMFRTVSGLRQLRVSVPTEQSYKAQFFVYNCTSLELLTVPEGIRFSNFSNFANYSSRLEQVVGAIDLTESTLNENCFSSCSMLREVRFVPESIYASLHFRQSDKLSPETVASILAGLADVNDRETQSLFLHATVKKQLTPEQLAAVAAKNWEVL
jgi:hypothetical protein